MKKLIFILLLGSFGAHAQDSARVNTRQGIQIYVFCQPLRPYEVVKRVNNEDLQDASTAVTDAINGTKTVRCKSLTENLDIMIDEAVRLKSKKKSPVVFDAIMTDDGTNGSLIKWK